MSTEHSVLFSRGQKMPDKGGLSLLTEMNVLVKQFYLEVLSVLVFLKLKLEF